MKCLAFYERQYHLFNLSYFSLDYLTFEEFVDICEQIPLTTRDELIKAFKKIDINGDGFITNDELFKVMTTVQF